MSLARKVVARYSDPGERFVKQGTNLTILYAKRKYNEFLLFSKGSSYNLTKHPSDKPFITGKKGSSWEFFLVLERPFWQESDKKGRFKCLEKKLQLVTK